MGTFSPRCTRNILKIFFNSCLVYGIWKVVAWKWEILIRITVCNDQKCHKIKLCGQLPDFATFSSPLLHNSAFLYQLWKMHCPCRDIVSIIIIIADAFLYSFLYPQGYHLTVKKCKFLWSSKGFCRIYYQKCCSFAFS